MKKFLALMIMAAVMISAAGCGTGGNKADEKGSNTEQSENKTDEKGENSEKDGKGSSKGKYDNITADSSPVGVDEVKLTQDGNYTELSGRIYKNGGDIEESRITVTFEIYDENGDFIDDRSVTTREALSEGEQERFDVTFSSSLYEEDIPTETLEKHTIKIIKIEELDAAEVELAYTLEEIRNLIVWDHNYEKAQILIDEVLKEYPDNVDVKLLQADLNEAVGKEAAKSEE